MSNVLRLDGNNESRTGKGLILNLHLTKSLLVLLEIKFMGAEPAAAHQVAKKATDSTKSVPVMPLAKLDPVVEVNAMHPSLSAVDRFMFSLSHASATETAENLRAKGFQYSTNGSGRSLNDYTIWKPGETLRHKIDPSGWLNMSDVGGEMANAAAFALKMVPAVAADTAKVGGILFAAPTGGSSYAATALGGAMLVGGTELAAQLIGWATGYRDGLPPVNVSHVLMYTLAGAAFASAFKYFAATATGKVFLEKCSLLIGEVIKKVEPLLTAVKDFVVKGGNLLSTEGKALLEKTMKGLYEKTAPAFEKMYNGLLNAMQGNRLQPQEALAGGGNGRAPFRFEGIDPTRPTSPWKPGMEGYIPGRTATLPGNSQPEILMMENLSGAPSGGVPPTGPRATPGQPGTKGPRATPPPKKKELDLRDPVELLEEKLLLLEKSRAVATVSDAIDAEIKQMTELANFLKNDPTVSMWRARLAQGISQFKDETLTPLAKSAGKDEIAAAQKAIAGIAENYSAKSVRILDPIGVIEEQLTVAGNRLKLDPKNEVLRGEFDSLDELFKKLSNPQVSALRQELIVAQERLAVRGLTPEQRAAAEASQSDIVGQLTNIISIFKGKPGAADPIAILTERVEEAARNSAPGRSLTAEQAKDLKVLRALQGDKEVSLLLERDRSIVKQLATETDMSARLKLQKEQALLREGLQKRVDNLVEGTSAGDLFKNLWKNPKLYVALVSVYGVRLYNLWTAASDVRTTLNEADLFAAAEFNKAVNAGRGEAEITLSKGITAIGGQAYKADQEGRVALNKAELDGQLLVYTADIASALKASMAQGTTAVMKFVNTQNAWDDAIRKAQLQHGADSPVVVELLKRRQEAIKALAEATKTK